MRSVLLLLAVLVAGLAFVSASFGRSPTTYRIDHVTDGDTVVLRHGQKVRLVQIDTPEVFFGTECYGPQASAITKRLLPEGTRLTCSSSPGEPYLQAPTGLLPRHGSCGFPG
jgi:endonuclease YncB( thermonuclease family)